MGTTATLIVAVVIVLILAGIELKWVFGSSALLVGLGSVFIFSSTYRMERVLGFLNPWADPAHKGYQIIQALYAFGSGGIGGLGLGMSRQKFFYLPEAHTDFILAIIGEEAGIESGPSPSSSPSVCSSGPVSESRTGPKTDLGSSLRRHHRHASVSGDHQYGRCHGNDAGHRKAAPVCELRRIFDACHDDLSRVPAVRLQVWRVRTARNAHATCDRGGET